MRAVVQRVKMASVTVDGEKIASIGKGLLVLLGVAKDDNEQDAQYLTQKIINLRIFEDLQGKMNLALSEIQGQLLVVSQFTLYGDCRKGRRPGFDQAALPDDAKRLYELFVSQCRAEGIEVRTGQFQADMLVDIANDGPVTMLLDSKKNF